MQHGVAYVSCLYLGQQFMQRAALGDGGGGDDSPLVRHALQAREFSGRKLHKSSDKCIGMGADRTERGTANDCNTCVTRRAVKRADFRYTKGVCRSSRISPPSQKECLSRSWRCSSLRRWRTIPTAPARCGAPNFGNVFAARMLCSAVKMAWQSVR